MKSDLVRDWVWDGVLFGEILGLSQNLLFPGVLPNFPVPAPLRGAGNWEVGKLVAGNWEVIFSQREIDWEIS